MQVTIPIVGETREEGALGSYLRAARAHLPVLLLVTLMCVAGAGAILSRKEPVYKATAEVLITPMSSDEPVLTGLQLLRESNDPTRITQTAADLLDSGQAAQLAAARVGRGYSRAEVQDAVDVQPKGQSNIVAITARAPERRLAATLSNTFVRSALDTRAAALRAQARTRIDALRTSAGAPAGDQSGLAILQAILAEGDPTMSVAQAALAPSRRSGTPTWAVLILAAIAGLTIGSAAAVLIELADRRIRDPRELLEIYPLPVLSRIPRIPRSKLGRRGSPLALPPAAREAYRTLQVQLEQLQPTPRVVSIVSPNAGDGKTNVAAQLAMALIAAGRSVVLIDFDLRKPDIAGLFGLPPANDLANMVMSDCPLRDVLVSRPELHGLRVLRSAASEDNLLLLSAFERRLPAIRDEALALADYVLLDTAPLGEVSDALHAVRHSDEVLVVARPNNTQRQDLESMRELLERTSVAPAGLVLVAAGRARTSYRLYGIGADAARPQRRLAQPHQAKS